MARITKLTPEQAAAIPLWRARYLERGTATGPCDRPTIEAAIAKLYESQGRTAPALVVWMDSPLGGLFAAGVLAGYANRDQLGGQLRGQLRDQLRGQLRDQLWGQLGDQLGGQLWGQLWDQLGDQLRDQLRDQLGDQLGDQLWGQLRDQLYRCGWGQHDGPWLGWLTFGRYLGARLEPSGGLDALDALCDAGWWWPFEGAVVLTDRPAVLARDERGRLHSENGPAMAYADGWGVHAWHGVRVPSWVIETPAEQVTAAQVTGERNAEIRRVLVERIGTERYIEISGASEVHRDDWGTLYVAQREREAEYAAVRVLNSTPEPDGSTREFWLRVPGKGAEQPDRRCVVCDADIAREAPLTAKGAIAWTFRLCEADYSPAVMS
jgi:hypothetical protein